MRLSKVTCNRILKTRDDLTEAERHDLAAALSRWARSEHHATLVAAELPHRPTAVDVRKVAARIRPASTIVANPHCKLCFGSGFAVSIDARGYSGARPCPCTVLQPTLSGDSAAQIRSR